MCPWLYYTFNAAFLTLFSLEVGMKKGKVTGRGVGKEISKRREKNFLRLSPHTPERKQKLGMLSISPVSRGRRAGHLLLRSQWTWATPGFLLTLWPAGQGSPGPYSPTQGRSRWQMPTAFYVEAFLEVSSIWSVNSFDDSVLWVQVPAKSENQFVVWYMLNVFHKIICCTH